MRVFFKIRDIFFKILWMESIIGACWIVVLMLLITADVIGRVFFASPIQGTAEVVANSIVAIAFTQFAYCLIVGKHVRTTAVYDKVSDKWKNILDIASYTIGIFVFSILIAPAVETAISAFQTSEFEGDGAARVITWPAKSIIALGYIFMTLGSLFLLVEKIMAMCGKTNTQSSVEDNATLDDSNIAD